MKSVLLAAVVFTTACSKTKIPECEELLGTVSKIEKCETIPADKRADVTASVKQLRSALKMLEDIGDKAEKSQLESLAHQCKSQNTAIRDLYVKVAPECIK